MFNFFKRAWVTLPDPAKRVVHAFWESFLAVFSLSATGLITSLLKIHSWSDVQVFVASLAVAIGAAALSAAKSAIISRQQ